MMTSVKQHSTLIALGYKYFPHVIFLLLSFFLHHKIILNITTYTFNFEDNIGYAYKINEIGKSLSYSFFNFSNPFIDISQKGIQIVSPLQEFLGSIFTQITPFGPILIINLFILINYFLANLFTYKLINLFTHNRWLSIFGGVFFGFSSLAIYITWFNLTGFCFLPALLYFIFKYDQNKTVRNWTLVMLFTFLLSTSSTYYIPYPYILLISLFAIYHKHHKTLVLIGIAIFLGTLLALIIYLIPIIAASSMDSVNTRIDGAVLNYTGRDIFQFIHSNNFNPITTVTTIKKLLPSLSYFRYSSYFGTAGTILLLASIFSSIKHREKITSFALLLFCIGLLLFAGDYLIIFNHSTKIPLPMHFIHQIPYGAILRKSIYFFHFLALSATILITKFLLKLNFNKKTLLIFILILIIFLENIFSFKRPVHDVPDRSQLYSHIDGSYVGLPNTNFSSNSFALDASIYSTKNDFKYGDIFMIEVMEKINEKQNLPNPPTGLLMYNNRKVYFGGVCYLDSLIYNLSQKNTLIHDLDNVPICDLKKDFEAINNLEIQYFVIYKKYITDFWFTCNENCSFYTEIIDALDKNTEYLEKTYEDDQGIIYKIKK